MGDKEAKRQKLLQDLDDMGLNPLFIINESFLGYKWRKERKKLYSTDDRALPARLIKMYYGLTPDEVAFNKMKKRFIRRYIANESDLEEVHDKSEILGLKVMYDYIHSREIDKNFDVYTLCELHRKLYQFTPFPEAAGFIRNQNVYLPGTGTELCDYSYIRPRLNEIDEEVQYLRSISKEIRRSRNVDDLLAYLDLCVEVNCELIKVHPFMDGNGRTIRAFTNKLLEDAGLPPIYIGVRERGEYQEAMNKANNEGDYRDIKDFYRYKVCDSIVELDINDRIKFETDPVKIYQRPVKK